MSHFIAMSPQPALFANPSSRVGDAGYSRQKSSMSALGPRGAINLPMDQKTSAQRMKARPTGGG